MTQSPIGQKFPTPAEALREKAKQARTIATIPDRVVAGNEREVCIRKFLFLRVKCEGRLQNGGKYSAKRN
jgi:hypothetical protein